MRWEEGGLEKESGGRQKEGRKSKEEAGGGRKR